jgi:hypothetical protein
LPLVPEALDRIEPGSLLGEPEVGDDAEDGGDGEAEDQDIDRDVDRGPLFLEEVSKDSVADVSESELSPSPLAPPFMMVVSRL